MDDWDGDGVSNDIDRNAHSRTDPLEFSDVPNGGVTSGEIHPGDQLLTVTDILGDKGVWISADPSGGSEPALLMSCGKSPRLQIPAGSHMIVTCGNSVTAEAIIGTVEVTFLATDGTTATLNLGEMNGLTFDPVVFTITALSTNPDVVDVFVDGTEFPVVPGETLTINTTGMAFTVNTTDDVDDGTCDAIHCNLREAINAANATELVETIAFNIPGGGPYTIKPTSALAEIRSRVIIDGTTQPGFRDTPIIELDGTNAGAGADGLTISADNSTVRGLVINRFDGVGIHILGAASNQVQGNLIAYNNGPGVAIAGGINNRIRSNAIHSNGGVGIDLGSDDVTYNDLGDGDTGANHLQNFPVLAVITNEGTHTTIEGALNSTANTDFRVEFFSSMACDPSDYGEGETFLGSIHDTTDGDGNARFVVTFPTGGLPDQSFTATATDADGNTSEFSRCTREITLPSGFSADAFYLNIPVPDGIAVRYGGSLFVVNEDDPKGVFMATRGDLFDLGDRFSAGWNTPYDSPDDILLHPFDETVFVVDGQAETLFEIPNEGGAPKAFVTPSTILFDNNFNPFGIALAPSGFDGPNVDPGDLIVADNAYSGSERAVWAIHPRTGDARAIAQGSVFDDGPTQVAFSPDGRLFVHENYWIPGTSRIVILDAEGTVTPFLSDIPGAHQSLCIHPVTGEVYFGMGELGEIRRIPSTGGTPEVFPGSSEVFASDLVFFQDIEFTPDGLTLG